MSWQMQKRFLILAMAVGAAAGMMAQDPAAFNADPNCSFFDSARDKAAKGGPNGFFFTSTNLSAVTNEVTYKLAPEFVPGGTRSDTTQQLDKLGTIDRYIFKAIQDAEYIRRVTLDLTGRIPDPARFVAFLADIRKPYQHRSFSQGFHFSRRLFFELAGARVTASYLVGNVEAEETSVA